LELLPLKASFAPGEPIVIEIDGPAESTVTVSRLDCVVVEARLASEQTRLELDPLPIGGYGVDVVNADGVVRTAFDVLADPLERPRYGFVSRYERGRDVSGVARNARRLHLNAIQFYDWMYRHADLLPPNDDFEDALGRPVSLETVRALAQTLRAGNSLPLAYAAVYAVGRDEWPRWEAAGLFRADGRPWTLGDDFLWIVDPADPAWLAHFTSDLAAAVRDCEFAGFHLDQYGDPKRATRADGAIVDLAEAFPRSIAAVRRHLPDARLIFNNVNNFPTWSTASAPQDAIYIEVWPPHTRFDHLARLITQARAAAPDKPVIIAAYLSVFAGANEDDAMNAARLAMATIFSHGGSHLLAGEEGAVLVDPYYVRHHPVLPATAAMLGHWYDFAVRYGDLLYERAVDVTMSITGGVNEDVIVEADVAVSIDPKPKAIWLRAVETRHGLIVHLIDLSAEGDLDWDAPKHGGGSRAGVTLHVRRTHAEGVTVMLASPESTPALVRAVGVVDGDYEVFELPSWRMWCVVWIRDAPLEGAGRAGSLG
jgi:dextranase